MRPNFVEHLCTAQVALAILILTAAAFSSQEPFSGTSLFGERGIPILDYSVENYGEYAVFNPPADILSDHSQIDRECTNTVSNINLSSNSSGWYCASLGIFVARKPQVPRGGRTLHPRPHALSYSISVDDDENYSNITLPSQICPYAVIGDLLSPQGDLMENVTLARIHDTIRSLSSTEQKSYMSTILLDAKNEINALLSEYVCDVPTGGYRSLLWNGQAYHAQDVRGYCSLLLTGGAVEFGIAYGSYVLSGYEGTEVHFSNGTKGFFAAGAAVLLTGVGVLWTKWHADGYFKSMDAIVASAFVVAVKGFAAGMKTAATGICTGSAAVARNIQNLYASSQCCGPQVIGNANAPGIEMQPQADNNAAQQQAGPMQGVPAVLQGPQC